MTSKYIPGFGGHVSQMDSRPLLLKTMVSAPMPLKERVLPVQAQRSPATSNGEGRSYPTKSEVKCNNVFLPKRHAGHTTYTASANATIKSANDVPPRANENTYGSGTKLGTVPFDGTTTQKGMSVNYAFESQSGPAAPVAFYSQVRQVERVDDDTRHATDIIPTRSGASKQLRCSAIVDKREFDPTFSPPKPQFVKLDRAKPSATSVNTLAKQAPAANTRLAALPFPKSSSQVEYTSPAEKASVAKSTLAAKSYTRLNVDRAIVGAASTGDLFAGTAKAREEVASGFMGHVPASPSNATRLKGDADVLRPFSKSFVCVTKPSANSTTAMNRASLGPGPLKTMQAEALERAATSPERAMNRVEFGRSHAVRDFFTTGVGDSDNVVADQFCMRFRPLEGVMKHGPPDQHSWISDKELRTRTLTS